MSELMELKPKMMTYKQIKKEAVRRIKLNWAECFLTSLFFLSVFVFLLFIEMFLHFALNETGFGWLYNFEKVFDNPLILMFLLLRILVVYCIVMPETLRIARMFWTASKGMGSSKTAEAVNGNLANYLFKTVKASAVNAMVKMAFAIPALISISIAVMFMRKCLNGEITTINLLGFSSFSALFIVFTILIMYTFLQFSLVPALYMTNPHLGAYEILKLSAGLMSGNKLRLVGMYLRFSIFLPLAIFAVPIVFILPYCTIVYLVFVEDVLSDYAKDRFYDTYPVLEIPEESVEQ